MNVEVHDRLPGRRSAVDANVVPVGLKTVVEIAAGLRDEREQPDLLLERCVDERGDVA